MIYYSKQVFRAGVLALWLSVLVACGGGGSGSAPAAAVSLAGTPVLNALPTPPAVKNQLAIYVDSGPKDTGYNVNRLYTNVTICHPGKSSAASPTQCQTIDHVLVDTGSTGLRLLSSAMAPALDLTRVIGPSGFPLLNCAQFVDTTFAWGPVVSVDLVLAGMPAVQVPIQVIGDPTFDSLSATCSSSAADTSITTAALLGANGVIGLGLFKEDCGSACVTMATKGFYYTCANAICASTVDSTATLAQQVKNPVPFFSSDSQGTYNDGILIDLPPVSAPGLSSLNGSLFFGIGTVRPVTVLNTNVSGFITTRFAGRNLYRSFIDSGSNGFFFDASVATCKGVDVTGFYCPVSPVTFSVNLQGDNSTSSSVSFTIANALALFGSGVNSVLPTLGGTFNDPTSFDWGLPFFFGRPVFMGIEGQASALGTGPFYAF